jgi:hypothetical protein
LVGEGGHQEGGGGDCQYYHGKIILTKVQKSLQKRKKLLSLQRKFFS